MPALDPSDFQGSTHQFRLVISLREGGGGGFSFFSQMGKCCNKGICGILFLDQTGTSTYVLERAQDLVLLSASSKSLAPLFDSRVEFRVSFSPIMPHLLKVYALHIMSV